MVMHSRSSAGESLPPAFHAFEEALMRSSFGELVRRVHELDLTLSQLAAMSALEEPGWRTVSEVAENIGLSVAATSALVERLRTRDLVARDEDSGDRRVKHVSLTARGREALERVASARERALGELLESLPDELRNEFVRVIGRVADELEREAPPGCVTGPHAAERGGA